MARRRMREEWGSVTELERGKRYRLRYWAETPNRHNDSICSIAMVQEDARGREGTWNICQGGCWIAICS